MPTHRSQLCPGKFIHIVVSFNVNSAGTTHKFPKAKDNVCVCVVQEIRSDGKSNQYPHESAKKVYSPTYWTLTHSHTHAYRTFDDSKYNYTHFLLLLTDVHSISLFHLSLNLSLSSLSTDMIQYHHYYYRHSMRERESIYRIRGGFPSQK